MMSPPIKPVSSVPTTYLPNWMDVLKIVKNKLRPLSIIDNDARRTALAIQKHEKHR